MLNTASYPDLKEYQQPSFKLIEEKQRKIDEKIDEMKKKIGEGDIGAIVAVLDFYGSMYFAQPVKNLFLQPPILDTPIESQMRAILNSATQLEARRRVDLQDTAYPRSFDS